MKYTQLYSITPGKRPDPAVVETGEIWINIPDGVIGTKDAENNIVQLATNGDYISKSGAVEGITSGPLAEVVESNAITVDDDSTIAIRHTLTAAGATINCAKTTSDKAVKLTLVKPEGVTCNITWQGVDSWLSTADTPQFGESAEAQELCVAIFSSPTYVAVNTVYNTENPTEVSDASSLQWGQLYGDIAEQTDLIDALAAKADASALEALKTEVSESVNASIETLEQKVASLTSAAATKADPQFTGTATLNGKNIATADQIPDVSHFVEDTVYEADKATFLTKSEASTTYATPTSVSQAISSLNISQYATTTALESAVATKANLSGAAFTGAVTVQTPTESNNPATKAYVDAAVSSVYKYKGSVVNQAALPSSNQVTGDVYNVEDTGDNYAWDGSKWDKLAGTVDLSAYLTIANASQTYLTKADASTTYATVTSLNEAVSNAQATYQVKGDYATNTALAAKADASALTNYLTLAGGTLTGNLTAPKFIGALQGNADTASALATARTISISGDATGSATFNGSANADIALTVNHAAAADSATTASACTGNSATATKATQDANGNVIDTTYATVAALNALISRVSALETNTAAIQHTGENNTTISGTLTIA